MSIEKRFSDIVEQTLGVDAEAVTPEANFIHDLGSDSLDQVEIFMRVEQEFSLAIPDNVVFDLDTVGKAIEYIRNAVRH